MTMSTAACRQPGDRALLLGLRDEPRQQTDGDRECREALAERPVMLVREDRRRDEDGDLLAVLDRLECGAQGDLGLAVADVAEDEPVHRSAGLHVGLDLGDGPQLVGRLLVRERRFELGLPWRVGREGVAASVRSGRVQVEQLLRQVADRLADPLLRPQPVGATELRQGRVLAARVARDAGDLLDRDEDPVAGRERQLEEVAVVAGPAAATKHLLVAGDAVVDVDDQVARAEPLEDVAWHDPPERLGSANADRAEQLPVGDDDETIGAAGEATVQAPLDEADRASRRCLADGEGRASRVSALGEELGESGGLVGRQHDTSALLEPGVERLADPSGPGRGQGRFVPAEQVARAQPTGGHRRALGCIGFPRQLEGPGLYEPGLPVPRWQVRRRPVLRQLAGLDELLTPLVGLTPQERRRVGDVTGLVEDEQRARWNVVEAGRRRDDRRPDLGRVADRQGPVKDGRFVAVDAVALDVADEAREIGGQSLGQPGRTSTQPIGERGRAAFGTEELAGRQEDDLGHLADAALIGRVETPKRIHFVAEHLDPDGELGGRREQVDDAASPGELAATGDLEHWLVAERQEIPQEHVEREPDPGPDTTRLGGQVVWRDRVLEQRLDARHEDPSAATPPCREGGDPRGGLIRNELAALICERSPRLEDGDGTRVAEPAGELLRDSIADLGIPGDPQDPLPRPDDEGRREIALCAVRDGCHRGMASAGPWLVAGWPEPLGEGLERAARGEQRRKPGQVRLATAGAWDVTGDPLAVTGFALAVPSFALRIADLALARQLDLSLGARPVEVDLGFLSLGQRPTRGPVRGDLLGETTLTSRPSADRLARPLLAHRSSPSLLPSFRTSRQPVFVRRTPSGPGGPSTSPGAAVRVGSAGRSSNVLNRFAALLVPSRAHASTASAAASMSSSSRSRSSGWKRLRTWSTAPRPGSPMPTRRRLNFSLPSSSMIERSPL